MLLIYSTFVLACLWRARVQAWLARWPGSATRQLFVCFLVAGSVTEILAWLNNYAKAAVEPALLHPQLFADLILGLGFYGGWALAWRLALAWFRFSLAEGFVITGLQGIFFEQLGAAFRVMVQLWPEKPLMSVIFGLYVFAVHGSAAGLGLAPVMHRFDRPEQGRHWARFPVVVVLMVALAFTGVAFVGVLIKLFGGLPPRQSILEHPFW